MKTVFVFDTVLLKDKKNNFYAQTLTYDFFKNRYLDFCDEMIISTRSKEIEELTEQNIGYRKTNGEKVAVCPIKSYKDIPDIVKNKKKIMSEMDEIVKNCDNLIIRMPSVLGFFACKSARKYKKNYVVEMVACAWDGYMNHARFGGKILAPIMYLKTRYTIKKAPNVLYVTEKFLQKRYPNSNNNIGCSDVVIEEISKSYIDEKKKQLEKTNCKELKIVTVASVQLKYKGQEYVMKAISDLKEDGLDIKYYLIGGGNNERLKEFVKKYNIEDNVIFKGSFPHNEIPKLLSEMDLYVQPSLQEGLPRAMIEAMSVGMPIIGSNAGGIPELIDHKCIFKKKDTKKIVFMLENIDNSFLVEQSEKNYLYSKKFYNTNLYTKRKLFYKDGLGL
jgi:glycosyltransferase, family 1